MQSPLTCSSQLSHHCKAKRFRPDPDQLQSVIWPFLKVFVKENASEQLQCVIWPFLKGFVKENASEQLQSVI